MGSILLLQSDSHWICSDISLQRAPGMRNNAASIRLSIPASSPIIVPHQLVYEDCVSCAISIYYSIQLQYQSNINSLGNFQRVLNLIVYHRGSSPFIGSSFVLFWRDVSHFGGEDCQNHIRVAFSPVIPFSFVSVDFAHWCIRKGGRGSFPITCCSSPRLIFFVIFWQFGLLDVSDFVVGSAGKSVEYSLPDVWVSESRTSGY